MTINKNYVIISLEKREEIFMSDIAIIAISILVSIPMAIIGAYIGIWLRENFSIKYLFHNKSHKYLL